MAPKEPYKVHSLKKHIENVNKGLSPESQYNRRPIKRAAQAPKKTAGAAKLPLLRTANESDDDSSDSDDSSDDDGADFLKKLLPRSGNQAVAGTGSKRGGGVDEIADSEVERTAVAKKAAASKEASVKMESESSTDTDSEADKINGKAKTNGVQVKREGDDTSSDDSTSDSESDEDGEDAKAKASTVSQVKKEEDDASSDDSTSDSESEDEGENGKPLARPTAASKKSESTSDSESSDSSSDSDAEAEPRPTTIPTVVAAKTKSASSGAGKGDVVGTATKAKKAVSESSSESSSEGSSAGASGGDSDSDSDMVDESIHLEDRKRGQVTLPSMVAPDFTLRRGDDGANGEDVVRICNEASMQGKQFWYFTLPSNVPISVIQDMELPTDASEQGGRVFSQAGGDYGVSFDSMAPKSSIQIMIPSGGNSQYQAAPRRVDQLIQVRRITHLGGAATAGPRGDRPHRPQPAGLKARFQPMGVTSAMGRIGMEHEGPDDDDDTEMVDGSPEKTSGKRKLEGGSGGADASRKTKRKHSSSEDEATPGSTAEQVAGKGRPRSQPKKQRTTTSGGSPDLGSEQPSPAAGEKQRLVVPPPVPGNASSSLGAGTPAKVKSKKSRKSKAESGEQPSSQSLPVHVQQSPARQTAVPIPHIPHSSQPSKMSAVHAPAPGKAAAREGKTSATKRKGHGTKQSNSFPMTSSPMSPPPSGQASSRVEKKVTPVPPPVFRKGAA
ncbi:hypothetical protein RJ55_01967 [Drechmeria coniospora]|nr:hypothetical protein RJ55_01967 [Drechmeria coniospora]